MSWLARSIAATLSSAPSDDDDDDHSEENSGDKSSDHASNADAEEDEQPDTPSRGVKGDISELTESLTRRFWGVATFLAPPPTAEAEAETAAEAEDGTQSPRVAGIRSDLAEIGGRVRSGISMLSNANAVAEISKIASSFLPFVPEAEEEDEVEAVGVTEEVVVFVRHISTHPETWRDFPLFVDDRHADDFELSDTQYEHALAIERIVPSLSYLRTELCSTNMSEACFWKIYFVLLHSKLNKQDAELLSTTQTPCLWEIGETSSDYRSNQTRLSNLHLDLQMESTGSTAPAADTSLQRYVVQEMVPEAILKCEYFPRTCTFTSTHVWMDVHRQSGHIARILEAREELLQSSPRMKRLGSEGPGGSSENKDTPSTQAEDREFSPSSVQYKSGMSEATSFREPTPDPLPGVEAIKHPISTSEPKIVDKSVVEEELVVKNEMKNIPAEKPNPYTPEDDDDKEVEEWLEDMDHVSSKTGNITSAVNDEDVSFSDLEDDDDD